MTEAPLAVYGFALLTAVLWGFTPVLDRRGMDAGGEAVQGAIIVVAVDSCCYWLALAVLEWPDPLGGLGTWALWVFAVAGVLGTALGRIAVLAGVARVGASVSTAGLSTRPLFATALAAGFLSEPVGPLTVVGIAVLVGGLAVLSLSEGGDIDDWGPRDMWIPIAAAAVFAAGNVVRRFGLQETDASTLQAVAINETAALGVLVGYALVRGQWGTFRPDRRAAGYFAASGLLTAVALFSFFAAFALEAGRVALVDSLEATAPLFTLVFAALLLGDVERVTRGVVAGAVLVVCGATLVVL